MKKGLSDRAKAWLMIAAVALLICVFAFADDVTVLCAKNNTVKEITSVCENFGLENVNIRVSKNNETSYGRFVATVYADGEIEESKFFELFSEINGVCEEYEKKMRRMNTDVRFFDTEYVFGGNHYRCDGGVIYKDGEAVFYETTEIMLRETYGGKIPSVGMPERAVDMTAYGYSYVDASTGTEYWEVGDYRYYFVLSENEKDFDGFTDRYVVSIESVYIPPSTTAKPTVKQYKKPKKTEVHEEDPYDVYDYIHPEDFYYDHYDDFFDFYDAENYFDDHHNP